MNVILVDKNLQISGSHRANYLFLGASDIPQLATLFNGVDYTLTTDLAKLYDVVVDSIQSQIVDIEGKSSDGASMCLIRAAVTPIVHLFVERLSRLLHLVGSTQSPVVVIPQGVERSAFLTIESLLANISDDPIFNQLFISDLAVLCGAQTLTLPVNSLSEADPSLVLAHRNTNFLSVSAGERLPRFLVKKCKALRRIVNTRLSQIFGREMVLAPGTSTQYYREFGVIGAGYWRDPDHTMLCLDRLIQPKIDCDRRRHLFARVAVDIAPSVGQLLSKHKNADHILSARLTQALGESLAHLYPVWHLEGADLLLSEQRKLFAKSIHQNAYIGNGGFSTTHAAFRSVAKEQSQKKLIGFQHGGYYGYTRDLVSAIESEYRYSDEFITWGWREIDHECHFPLPRFRDLPSPWLSQRSLEWSKSKREMTKLGWPSRVQFDILYMPIHFYRFPLSPSGRAISTVCTLAENRQVFKDICSAANNADMKVKVKFFNSAAYGLLVDIAKLYTQKNTLTVVDHANKGMTPSLVQDCAFIVWDQPGTGFLECLAAGIPTLVLWRRINNSETRSSSHCFEALEKVGVIARDAESIIATVRKHRSDPLSWWNESARRDATIQFSNTYGRADQSWFRLWKSAIRKLRH
jgi:hypothetical protein